MHTAATACSSGHRAFSGTERSTGRWRAQSPLMLNADHSKALHVPREAQWQESARPGVARVVSAHQSQAKRAAHFFTYRSQLAPISNTGAPYTMNEGIPNRGGKPG